MGTMKHLTHRVIVRIKEDKLWETFQCLPLKRLLGLLASPPQPPPQPSPLPALSPRGRSFPPNMLCSFQPPCCFLCLVHSSPFSVCRPPLILKGGHQFQSLPFLSLRQSKSPSVLLTHSLHTGEVSRQDNWDVGLEDCPVSRSHDSARDASAPEARLASPEKWGREPCSCSVLLHVL